MMDRSLVSIAVLAALTVTLSLDSRPAGAQPARPAAAKAAAGSYQVPRTPWGDPDLQGAWTNTTRTPLERPGDLAGKQFLTEEDRNERDARAARNADRPPARGSVGAYNDYWFEKGSTSVQASLVVDPPDGRLPSLTAEAQKRTDALNQRLARPPASAEDMTLFERCITRGMPGTMLPGFYNHNYQILQAPGYVAIRAEMIHDARIIPLDGRPHLAPTIRQWLGDSRGRWEGNTLVVETTNFNVKDTERRTLDSGVLGTAVFGVSGNMTLVERFIRVDADRIDYRFTVTDPSTFTRPWTVATPMIRLDSLMFEYACHEGNYSIVNSLSGARAQEREAQTRR